LAADQLAVSHRVNAIEVVAYNARNLLASLPAQTIIKYDAPANAERPRLYILAIAINAYHDQGWMPPGGTKREYFRPLKLAVDDAKSIGNAFKEAGSEFYEQVIVKTAFDEEATAAGLERIVQDISAEITPATHSSCSPRHKAIRTTAAFICCRKTIRAGQILQH
jgi:hypothetical protein